MKKDAEDPKRNIPVANGKRLTGFGLSRIRSVEGSLAIALRNVHGNVGQTQ
jgi:hypothetical protein